MNNTNLDDIKGIRIAQIRKDGKAIELGLLTTDNRTFNLAIPMEEAEQIMNLLITACTSAKITQATKPVQEHEKRDWKATPEIFLTDEIQFVAQPASGNTYLVVSTPEGRELHISLESHQL